jgi:hypothetical protein
MTLTHEQLQGMFERMMAAGNAGRYPIPQQQVATPYPQQYQMDSAAGPSNANNAPGYSMGYWNQGGGSGGH